MTDEARQAWLDERLTYIGASEMAEAVGLSPWGDPISLWEKKTGQAPERDESFRMTLGSLVEPIIGKLASEALGAKLHRVTGPVRYPEHPFLASNPDFRIVGPYGPWGRTLVQAKFRLDGIEFGEPDESGAGESIPLHYRVQGWGELLTTGRDTVIFAVLDPRTGLSLHPLSRHVGDNEGAIEDLRADLVEFWTEYVEKGVMPPPSAQSGEALARRYPERKLKVGKIASAEQVATLQELLDARDAVKAAEERRDELTNVVKSWIGDAAWIEGGGKKFSWGETHRKLVKWELIAAAYRKLIWQRAEVAPASTAVDLGIEDFDIDDSDEHLRTMISERLDTIEGLYTEERIDRGPFTVAKI